MQPRSNAFRLSPPEGEVHLWYDVLDDEPVDVRNPATSDIVNPDDRDPCNRQAAEQRTECLTARQMLRSILSHYIPDVAPSEWRFNDAADGRWKVVAPSAARGLHFNLSHGDGIAACAVSGHYEVGVAVGRVRRPSGSVFDVTGLSISEVAGLRGLGPADRTRRLLEYRILREAFTRACGTSQTLEQHRPSFDVSRSGRPRVTFEGCEEDETAWQFDRLFIGAEHVVALATRLGVARSVAVVLRAFERAPVAGNR